MKYFKGQGVLNVIKPVSLPSRKVYCSLQEMYAVSAARNTTLLKGNKLGQITLIETEYGILEMKDAINKKVGGKVLLYCF